MISDFFLAKFSSQCIMVKKKYYQINKEDYLSDQSNHKLSKTNYIFRRKIVWLRDAQKKIPNP